MGRSARQKAIDYNVITDIQMMNGYDSGGWYIQADCLMESFRRKANMLIDGYLIEKQA